MNKPYTSGEIDSLCHKIIMFHYAALKLEALSNAINLKPIEKRDFDLLENTQNLFYVEALQIHLGAIISFFYNNEDQTILSRLNSKAEQLKVLYELRSVSAHILDFEEIDKLYKNYFQSPRNVPLIKDYEILRNYIFDLLDSRSENGSDFLKKELAEIKRRLF